MYFLPAALPVFADPETEARDRRGAEGGDFPGLGCNQGHREAPDRGDRWPGKAVGQFPLASLATYHSLIGQSRLTTHRSPCGQPLSHVVKVIKGLQEILFSLASRDSQTNSKTPPLGV